MNRALNLQVILVSLHCRKNYNEKEKTRKKQQQLGLAWLRHQVEHNWFAKTKNKNKNKIEMIVTILFSGNENKTEKIRSEISSL